MKAMVLTAGAGSRLRDLTQHLPKPMLEVNGHPILAYILYNLARHGFTEVILNLFYHPQAIIEYVGNGSRWGIEITYCYEKELLGTAGGVKNVEKFFDNEPFLVHYGDVLTDQDLSAMLDFHRQKQAMATLLVHQRARSNSVVFINSDSQITRLLERPTEEISQPNGEYSWVNSGVYLFQPMVLDSIPPNKFCDLPGDIFPTLIAKDIVYAYPLSGYRCAIDSPERLAQANADLKRLKLKAF